MEQQSIVPGIRGEKTLLVTTENTAAVLGSGCLPVFATPAMITLMELCAAESVGELLDEGFSTVGTAIDIKHLSATPVGSTPRASAATCRCTLPELVSRPPLAFKVDVSIGIIQETQTGIPS